MPTRFHSAYPGFGFAATHGGRGLEIRCHGGLYLRWRWIVDGAGTLQLSSRNHPSSLAERKLPEFVYLIELLKKVDLGERERKIGRARIDASVPITTRLC